MNEKRYKRNEQFIAASMNGETVMMDVTTGTYYNLGVTGGAIWEIVENATSLDEIVTKLLERFDVDAETCKSQVNDFLNKAVEKGFIFEI